MNILHALLLNSFAVAFYMAVFAGGAIMNILFKHIYDLYRMPGAFSSPCECPRHFDVLPFSLGLPCIMSMSVIPPFRKAVACERAHFITLFNGLQI